MRRAALALLAALLPGAGAADCVVVLHGLLRSDLSMTLMEEALEAQGYDVINADYPSTEAPIGALADVVPQAMSRCVSDPVHFVTHSMGGILVRHAFRDGAPDRIGRVVMLAPPNQGSQLVDALDDYGVFGWVTGPAGRQLGAGPGGLPKTLPPVDFPLGVIAGDQSLNPFFSTLIAGADDGKVAVRETRVDGMEAHLVLPVTHTWMMNNPRVIAQTLLFLETGAFDPSMTMFDVVTGEALPDCGDAGCGE